LDSLTKISSGITLQGQPIAIIASPGSSEIGFQLIAMRFVDNLTTPTQSVYEYYSVTFAEATFQEIANPQSLHSNRGYEVGIIYMDDFNRSSTALVSPNNTEYIPCGFSANKNGIRVTIPPTQIAPYWATRYKFVIKPDSENYEVIYTNLFFTDPNTNEVWFFLEGENTKKVEVGDRLIVKADTSGPLTNCAYATVLDKVSQQAGFIDPEGDFPVPAGVYMKINPNSFSAILDPEATVAFGREQNCAPKGGSYEKLAYLVNKEDPDNPGSYIDISIPAGSRINFLLDWSRIGVGSACEKRGYKVEKVLTSSADYDNFEDWFRGDNVEIVLTQGVSVDGITTAEFLPINGILSTYSFDVMYVQFYRDSISNALFLQLSTGLSCTGSGFPNSRQYCATADITVFRAIDTIIFETEPTDALPDVFYENNLSFSIDSNGNHMGNVVDQNIASGISGVVDTEFFNCFAFGNGAESYKIRDSIIGRSFTLGERVTSTSAQDYQEADRFADITYSGVFNAETNVNKLNEFNAGLLNYKNLEVSFGPIFILDGRETDVLALQEEKVSYVLAGKNLLSDSTGGGAIASVPEVLGTQIARNEKYGISFNPESYIQWGFNRFFTDVKRGAVIQLVGDSYSSEQLNVISEANMRTWFRDEFNQYFNTQKLGGFDPYMNEYVLTSNNIDLPLSKECISCGVTQTLNLSQPAPLGTISKKYCYDLGDIIGETSISWSPISNTGGNFQVKAKYNGTTYSSPVGNTSGSLTFDKDQILVNEVEVEIIFTSAALSLELTIDCPTPEELIVVQVVLTNNYEVGKSIHTQYRYTFGSFTGPLLSNYVIFGTGPTVPVVSRYDTIVGFEGQGAFPPGGSLLTMRTNKAVSDTFVFDPLTDKFRYARANVLYPNTQSGINTLLGVSSIASPISGGSGTFEASFTVPANTGGKYLYLIWDLRDSVSTELCYSSASAILPQKKSCCACDKCNSTCVSVQIVNTSAINGAEVYFPLGRTESCGTPSSTPLSIELDPGETFTTCLSYDDGLPFTVISGTASVEVVSCTCD
jgi:hypothetical protein